MDRLINIYKSTRNSKRVWKSVPLSEVIEMMQNSESALAKKNISAREALSKGNKELYKNCKLTTPTATPNFRFDDYRWNSNVIESTDLIYIDVDVDADLIQHPIIYISGESYSGTGRFYLIRSSGITPENFKYNCECLQELLPKELDRNAFKVNQQLIISYSPNLYVNNNSTIWNAKKPQYTSEKNKNIVRTELGSFGEKYSKLRFNNLDEITASIDFDGDAVYDAGKKIKIAEVFIPKRIEEGFRNKTLNAIGYQIRSLNKHITASGLNTFIQKYGRENCVPPYPKDEINQLVKSIMKVNPSDLKPQLNSEKRLFFNPDYNLTGKQRQQIAGEAIGKFRSSQTLREINETITTWEFDELGKITQKKIAERIGKSVNTIGNYSINFKEKMKKLNDEWKNNG